MNSKEKKRTDSVYISLCIIAKNEESNLATCLSLISDYVDEIIIIDTGSTDKTKDIALRYTEKVYDFQWNNNFSDARNFAIGKSSYDYILVLDCDEYVESIEIREIKELIRDNLHKVGRLLCINEYMREGTMYKNRVRLNRLFSKQIYRYEGSIHEQVVSKTTESYETYDIPLEIKHSGYDGTLETRIKKTERNIYLLKGVLKDQPNDPYIIYQLGKSYYMQEDYNVACGYFEKALCFDLDTKLEYVQNLVESYGYALLNTKQYDAALGLLNVYDEFSQSADFIYMIALVLMNKGRFQESIEEFIKATKKKTCKMAGVNGHLAFYNIGVIYDCLGDINNARKYYEMCGAYKLAKERLQILK